jgi:hypothetical protein
MWYHVGSIDEFPTERDLHLQPFGLFFSVIELLSRGRCGANLQERNE